jgi:hypothetical protein
VFVHESYGLSLKYTFGTCHIAALLFAFTV